MKKIIQYIYTSSIIFLLLSPGLALASTFIVCEGTPESPCGFSELMILINGLISFILNFMVLPIATAVLMYAGFLYMTSEGNAGKKGKALGMLRKLLVGLFFCLAAWVIVKIILTTFGYNETLFSPVMNH